MRIKTIVDEDFVNYKKPSMYIAMPSCSFKCCREAGISIEICQNSEIAKEKTINMNDFDLIQRYLNNPMTSAIVFSGLEPFDSFQNMFNFIDMFRMWSDDDIVIYTGYYPNEIKSQIEQLKRCANIIIKYGRYKQNQEPHYDSILGINLISDNQYAEKIS